MKKIIISFIIPVAVAFLLSSCHKPGNDTPATENSQVLHDFAYNVSQPGYNDLATKTATLYTDVQAFAANSTNPTLLSTCRTDWYAARTTYETTEGFLFGPIVTLGVDPGIDTWPVSYVDIDSVLNSGVPFNDSLINSLQDAQKGFHPIEYLLFGTNGSKTVSQFTNREIQFMVALSKDLQNQAALAAAQWSPSQSGNYTAQFINAGGSSTIYPTQKAAFEDIVTGMSGICDEVANDKMGTPFIKRDSTLQESLYSNNSMPDFKNNILGAQEAYMGKFTVPTVAGTQGQSLQNFVKQYSLTVNDSLNIKFAQALTAMNGITVSYGTAIYQQPTQLQNAINAVGDLQSYIDNSLMPLVKLHTN